MLRAAVWFDPRFRQYGRQPVMVPCNFGRVGPLVGSFLHCSKASFSPPPESRKAEQRGPKNRGGGGEIYNLKEKIHCTPVGFRSFIRVHRASSIPTGSRRILSTHSRNCGKSTRGLCRRGKPSTVWAGFPNPIFKFRTLKEAPAPAHFPYLGCGLARHVSHPREGHSFDAGSGADAPGRGVPSGGGLLAAPRPGPKVLML